MHFTSTPRKHFGSSVSKFKAMGATVNILQSEEKCIKRNVILPFLMNSYSELEYNQALKEHFLSSLVTQSQISSAGIKESFRVLPTTSLMCDNQMA